MTSSTLWADAHSTTQYPVHLGTWTNWSRGQVMGATLTTTREYGNLFIAFTAFFVSFVASRFWKIVCLAFHRYYSSSREEDALHHQRQAVLRNSGSSLEGLWMFTRLTWAWRSTARRCLLRMLPAVLTASFFLALFSIAGGFSSQISSAVGSDVLLDGSNCGVLATMASTQTVQAASILYSNLAQKTAEAANYAQQCYSNSPSGMLDCTSFVVNHLSSSANTQAPCPFPGANICRLENSNLHLDTGLLDSNDFFGLNTPQSQRIFFRNVLECAPLVTEKFSHDIHTSVNNYTVYNYGPNFLEQNYTFQVETLAGQYYRQRDNLLRVDGANFVVNTFSSFTRNGSTDTSNSPSHFIPIPELFVDDGDLHLVSLQGNGVYFYENTTDPWYRATQAGPTRHTTAGPDNSTSKNLYRPQDAASPLGCIEKYQFCNAGKECGPLAGAGDFAQSGSLFNISTYDLDHMIVPDDLVASRFYWFSRVLSSMTTDLYNTLKILGPRALLSQQSLMEGIVGPLPDNQWQLEVTYWWSIRLASIQAAFVNAASAHNTGNSALGIYHIPPYNSHMQDMCNNQKVKSTDYTSFSLFGLLFTYTTGLAIVIISFSLEPVIACLHRRDQALRLKRGGHKHAEWVSNGTLQLQRLAYQGIGSGKWSGCMGDIPMTESNELLGDLTRAYPEVPPGQEHGAVVRDGKSHNTPFVHAVIAASADDGSSESGTATTSSAASGAATTPVPEARNPAPAPGRLSALGDGGAGGDGRHLHQRTVSLVSVAGAVTPGSRTGSVSPVSRVEIESV